VWAGVTNMVLRCEWEFVSLVGSKNAPDAFTFFYFRVSSLPVPEVSPASRITSRVRLGRSTMACLNMSGLHAVARIPTRVVCTPRRPFQTTRVSLDNARSRQPAALAGFVSRRVKPHALRHTEQSIWMDQTRRHGRALGDTRRPGVGR